MTVRCPICREENPELATACRTCGAPLAPEAPSEESPPANATSRACPSCGRENPAEAAYCGFCGLERAATQQPSEGQSPAHKAVAGREYTTFWIRAAAWAVDAGILTVTQMLLTAGFGDLGLIGFLLLFAYRVLFTGLKGQTPGKMVMRIKVIDERGEVPGIGRALVREVPGRVISEISLGLGYAWAAWDDKKQAWHDKVARTYVVKVVS